VVLLLLSGCSNNPQQRESYRGLHSLAWHLSAGPGAGAGLASLYGHVAARGHLGGTSEIYTDVLEVESWSEPFRSLFQDFIGPYDFEGLRATLEHMMY
jgi:hypothetical protein